jgi:citrate lyase subunit beta/citryl-CoA lyase
MTDAIRPRRSVLYLPASNARAIEKAGGLAADAIILDLEDSVAPDAKPAARDAAVAAANARAFGSRETVIRVNGLDTPWGTDDLAAAASSAADAVLVPKISSAEEIAALDGKLGNSGAAGGQALWAMVEHPLAVLSISEIAAQARTTRLRAFVLGLNDLALAIHAPQTAGREAFRTTLETTVLAARAFGLAAIDGVFNGIKDVEGFAAECAQAARFGFDGKTLIHPSQIDPANAAFAPNSDAIRWSEAVRTAFDAPENQDKGVLSVEGRMVERLHLAEAERVLALADAIRRLDAERAQ